MLLFQRCYLEDRVWMSHLFWGNNCLSQQKLMFVWKFSNWPLTFFMNIERFSYFGYFGNALFEVFQFPEKDQIWFMFKEMKPPMRIWQCVDGHAICAGCRLGLAIRVRITMTIADWQLQWQWPAQYSLRDKLESKGCPSCSRSVLVCGFHLIFDFLASICFDFSRPGRLMGGTSLWRRWLGPCLGKTFVEQLTRAGNWLWSRTSAEENFVVCTKMGKCHRYKMFFVC